MWLEGAILPPVGTFQYSPVCKSWRSIAILPPDAILWLRAGLRKKSGSFFMP